MAEKEAEGIAEKRLERGDQRMSGAALTGTLCALGAFVVPARRNRINYVSTLLGYVAVLAPSFLTPAPAKLVKPTASGHFSLLRYNRCRVAQKGRLVWRNTGWGGSFSCDRPGWLG